MNRRRWLILLCAVPLLLGLARLRFDAEIFNLLPDELPAVRGLQLQQRHFSGSRELLITISASSPDSAASVAQRIAEHLGARTNLARTVRWQPPWLENPAAAADNIAWLWLQQTPDAVAALANRLATTNVAGELAAAREALATSLDPQELARTGYDPLGLTRLPVAGSGAMRFDDGEGIFSGDQGRFRLVFVEPPRDGMSYQQLARWLTELRSEVDSLFTQQLGSQPARVSYTGGPAFLAEIATGMESDMRSSVLSTLIVIGALFGFAHRSWRPLGLLLLGLLLTLVLTLALGGLVFGTLNVVSVGFAAVLLGLTVDYGLVSYQEFVASPGKSVAEVRHEVAPGIGWSAATTAGTFLLLGLAGLPGLAQLGALTALGLLVGAVVMLYVFLPLVMRRPPRAASDDGSGARPGKLSWRPAAVVAVAIGLALAVRGFPPVTSSADPLRPRQSGAYSAMDELKARLGRTNEPTWAVFAGADVGTIGNALDRAEAALASAETRGEVTSFTLPTGFWPRPDWAKSNQVVTAALASRRDEIESAVVAAGFTPDSLALARSIFAHWSKAAADTASPWPTNSTARWLVSQMAARDDAGRWLALGLIQPATNSPAARARLAAALPPGVLLTSWDSLGPALLGHVSLRVAVLTGLIAVVLAGCLWLAFRRWLEVVLGFVALGLSFSLLLAMMALLGWTWNLLSLVALPLLLGSSVDSTIHVQLALRRHGPDLRALWRTTGKALLLCAGANIAGFGSLAWSSNAGLASMDLICAVGVACVFTVCVGLLPGLWCAWCVGKPVSPRPASASALYRAGLWRAGLRVARILPRAFSHFVARRLAAFYVWARPQRLAVVAANLRPLVDDDAAAAAVARCNFAEFAGKLVDLWRYEAGCLAAAEVRPSEGWEHFGAALSSGRGVLLVTPHLGNWELGSLLLQQRGIRPLVLTAPEPEDGLTEVRRAARARLGIDTLVVGSDPFAFLEVIKRLQAGGVIALLLDRPPAPTQVTVELFGRPFFASNAAAELARATGCLVLPVFIVREGDHYRAGALTPVAYERADLGDRARRIAFTGTILRAFEPVLRQHADQWFHFVPLWPEPDAPR